MTTTGDLHGLMLCALAVAIFVGSPKLLRLIQDHKLPVGAAIMAGIVVGMAVAKATFDLMYG